MGNFTGNTHIWWQNPWFPVKIPNNQPDDSCFVTDLAWFIDLGWAKRMFPQQIRGQHSALLGRIQVDLWGAKTLFFIERRAFFFPNRMFIYVYILYIPIQETILYRTWSDWANLNLQTRGYVHEYWRHKRKHLRHRMCPFFPKEWVNFWTTLKNCLQPNDRKIYRKLNFSALNVMAGNKLNFHKKL